MNHTQPQISKMKSTKMIMMGLLLTITFVLFSLSVVAQGGFDPISLNYRSIPSQGQHSISNFDARLNVPILISRKGFLMGGVAYSTRPDNRQGIQQFDLTLSTFAFNLSYIKPLNPTSRLLVSMNTGMYSDFKDITAEDFNTAVLALINKSGKNGFSYSYGLAYIRNFYGNSMLPFFGFSKTLSPTVTLNLMNPLNPSLSYKYSPTITYGMEGLFTSQDYRLSDEFQSLVYVDRTVSASPFVNIKMNNFSSLSFKMGYNFWQSAKIYEDVENASAKWFKLSNSKDPLYESRTSGVFFEAGIKLKFPTKTN